MEQAKADTLPPEIEAVHQRIEAWRRARGTRSRMPEDLWQAAASLAREHGMWRVSRALRVKYEGLKSRIAGGSGADSTPTPVPVPGFVDMTSMLEAAGSESMTTTVDLSRADGTRLLLRLPSVAVDVQSLIRAFTQPVR